MKSCMRGVTMKYLLRTLGSVFLDSCGGNTAEFYSVEKIMSLIFGSLRVSGFTAMLAEKDRIETRVIEGVIHRDLNTSNASEIQSV